MARLTILDSNALVLCTAATAVFPSAVVTAGFFLLTEIMMSGMRAEAEAARDGYGVRGEERACGSDLCTCYNASYVDIQDVPREFFLSEPLRSGTVGI